MLLLIYHVLNIPHYSISSSILVFSISVKTIVAFDSVVKMTAGSEIVILVSSMRVNI